MFFRNAQAFATGDTGPDGIDIGDLASDLIEYLDTDKLTEVMDLPDYPEECNEPFEKGALYIEWEADTREWVAERAMGIANL